MEYRNLITLLNLRSDRLTMIPTFQSRNLMRELKTLSSNIDELCSRKKPLISNTVHCTKMLKNQLEQSEARFQTKMSLTDRA